MPRERRARAVTGYDETLVLADGREFNVRAVGDALIALQIDGGREFVVAPHEARQVASLLRNGTELDYLPRQSCDEALASAREECDEAIAERDRLRRELEALAREVEREGWRHSGHVAARIDAILTGEGER